MATITTDQGATYAGVLGFGSYRPSRVITTDLGARYAGWLGFGRYRHSWVIRNAYIVYAIDSSDEWIQQRSGIKQRRFATAEETVQMMSVAAARKAIERAGIEPQQIDCVIVATVTHLLQTPAARTPPPHSTSRPLAPASATAWRSPTRWSAAAPLATRS